MPVEALRNDRRHKPPVNENRGDDPRSEAQRDCDRILNYSDRFHRLSGKSHIISSQRGVQLTHDRKTHAEKAAQMAEAIARHLLHNAAHRERSERQGGLDPLVVRAAAGAHGFGQPPFGHVGEEALSAIANAYELPEGYQTNAQAYRVICKLDVHPGVPRGLDPTFAVQHAVVRYPWTVGTRFAAAGPAQPNPDRHWGLYGSELKDFEVSSKVGMRDGLLPWQPTLEAALVDIADDITLALHDFEDFLKLKQLSLPELLTNGFWQDEDETVARLEARYPVEFHAWNWSKAVRVIDDYMRQNVQRLVQPLKSDTPEQDRIIREFTSHWLSRWLANISIDEDGCLVVDSVAWHEINVLKQIAWEQVIDSPALRMHQEGYRRLIHRLSAMLLESHAADPARCPGRLISIVRLNEQDEDWTNDKTDEFVVVRSVLDYVSGLTENQVREAHAILDGGEPGQSWAR